MVQRAALVRRHVTIQHPAAFFFPNTCLLAARPVTPHPPALTPTLPSLPPAPHGRAAREIDDGHPRVGDQAALHLGIARPLSPRLELRVQGLMHLPATINVYVNA